MEVVSAEESPAGPGGTSVFEIMGRLQRATELLNEVADLMKDASLDADAFHHLQSLQSRLHFAVLSSSLGQAAAAPLPRVAPEQWSNRMNRKESSVDFVRRVYSKWIGALARPDLRRLDPALYSALNMWIHQHGGLPPDLDIPTRKEINDRQLRALESAVKSGNLSKELRRLQSAASRRSS